MILAIVEEQSSFTGGNTVTRRNLRFLRRVADREARELKVVSTGRMPRNVFSRFMFILFSIHPVLLLEIRTKSLSSSGKLDIWLDRSTMGFIGFFLRCTLRRSELKLHTFFHNNEVEYKRSIAKTRMGWRYLLWHLFLVPIAAIQQRLSLVLSHKCYFISTSDRLELSASTGLVLPPTWEKLGAEKREILNRRESFCLVVGSAFPPNVSGMAWFKSKIAPFLPIKTIFVGGRLSSVFNSDRHVEVLADVEDIVPFYEAAKVVVVPVFYGAGLKVKLAEALHFGCGVVATSFSVRGLDQLGSFLASAQLIEANDRDFREKIVQYLESNQERFPQGKFSDERYFSCFIRYFEC